MTPKRKASLSNRLLTLLLIGGTLLALLFWVFSTFSELQTFNTLNSTGYRATSTITNNRIAEGSEDNRYYITYEFTAVDGQRYTREQQVLEDTYDAMEIGATLEVIYDSSNPEVSRLSHSDAEPDITRRVLELQACGLLILGFGLAIIIDYFRRRLSA